MKNTKVVVQLKSLSNIWRSWEISLINYKINLELNWIEDCILSSAGGSAKFKITDAKLYVPIVTLSTKDKLSLTKQLRSIHWSSYQTIPGKAIDQGINIYELLSASFQGVKRLFVLPYTIATDAANNEEGIQDNKKLFFTRGKIKNYNVLLDGRNFCDQPIHDLVKQYDGVRKVS